MCQHIQRASGSFQWYSGSHQLLPLIPCAKVSFHKEAFQWVVSLDMPQCSGQLLGGILPTGYLIDSSAQEGHADV